MIIGAVAAILTNVTAVFAPWVLKLAIDALQQGVSRSELLLYSGLLLGIAVVSGFFLFLMRWLLIGVSRYIERDLRNDLFAHFQKLPAAFYNRYRTGDLMARAVNDLDSVRMVLGPGIMYPLNTVTSMTFAIVMMLLISTRMTLYILIGAPVISVMVFILGRTIHRLHTRIQEQYSAISDAAQENLSGVRVVRAFAQEEREIRRFNELNREYIRRNLAMAKVQALFMPILFLIFEIGTAMLLLVGGRGIFRGDLTLGDFVAFVGYLGMLAWPVVAVGWVANLIQRGAASMKRIIELLDTEPEIAAPAEPRIPDEIRGDVVFENVSFQYRSGEPVLKDINLRIEAGKTVAIVGRTGSGKSTLISLITRQEDPTSGTVSIDGVPTVQWDLSRLRGMVGFVPQDPLLFSESVRKNIEFGGTSDSGERLRNVSEISMIDTDVQEFREGYETLVGERGLTLSGGQKGRTALARALYRDPKILILDDALAAVDTHTEEDILHGLRRFMRDRTSIIISHRVTTVRDADVIIVLDNGRIVERGSHDELIRSGGYYAELVKMQQLEEELRREE